MSTQSLNCPNCGAPLMNAAGKSTVICDHCGSLVAIHAQQAPATPPPNPLERRDFGSSGPDPVFQYGPTPSARPERSALTSLTLGPADAKQIVQMLRERQKVTAIQFYQSKVGGTLGDAKAAVDAIEAGLRDASAPVTPSISVAPRADMAEVQRLLAARDTIGAIQAYRYVTGAGLREARTAVEGMERQLYPGRTSSTTQIGRQSWSAARGCASVVLVIVLFSMCAFGGCGTYLQTQAIYKCSMREIRNAIARQDILEPPVNGGYLVISPGYNSSSDLDSWRMNADYLAPVWGSNGVGLVYAHVFADSDGRNSVSASIWRDGGFKQLLKPATIDCDT